MPRKTWFSDLFGFRESGYLTVKKMLQLKDGELISTANGRKFPVGEFSTPTLAELREKVRGTVEKAETRTLKLSHIAVSDIYATHKDPEYAGATFQVASQFNCLEFVSAGVIPEVGVTGYASDHTQGPACSLACPAATVYRNYFAKTPQGNEGQTKNDQINNLDGLEAAVDNATNNFWVTTNGYTNSTRANLSKFNKLCDSGEWKRPDLLETVKIGLHTNVEVISTFESQESLHRVNQAFCSGISISYSRAGPTDWEIVARIVLDAAYESTLLATVLESQKETGTNVVVLTFIGGGVFGNDINWIATSIGRACALLAHYDLDVRVAHYRHVNTSTADLINSEYERIYTLLQKKESHSHE